MPTITETLIASLTAVGEHGSWYPNPEDDNDSRYMDWTGRDAEDNYRFEVGDEDGDAITVKVSPTELRALHAALTLTLLRDQV